MKANMVDFRDKSKEIIKSIQRKEKVEVYYHKKCIGIFIPLEDAENKKNISKLAFVGSRANEKKSVDRVMDDLRRKSRHVI